MIPRLLGFVLLLLLGTAGSLRAHGMELLCGRIAAPAGDGEVVMELDVEPFILSFLAGDPPTELQTWGDLRARARAIADCFNASLRLRVAGMELAPATTVFRPLAGAYPPADAMNLPALVPLTVIWRMVPSSKFQVVPRFELPARNFLLLLDDAHGLNLALVDNGFALSDHTAPPGFPPVTATPSPPPAVESFWRGLAHAFSDGKTQK